MFSIPAQTPHMSPQAHWLLRRIASFGARSAFVCGDLEVSYAEISRGIAQYQEELTRRSVKTMDQK